jgi:hypothetical protein
VFITNTNDNVARFDCTSHNHERCLTLRKPFTCKLAGDKVRYTIRTAEDLEKALEDVKQRLNRPNEILTLMQMDVCPMGLFSNLSFEAVRLYTLSQTRALPWVINSEPAVYMRAVEVIESELTALRKMQNGK